MKFGYGLISVLGMTFFTAAYAANMGGTIRPPVPYVSSKTAVLKAAASIPRTPSPVESMDVYLSGFDSLKHAPDQQTVAHHFCNPVNAEFVQCALFDGNTRTAHLTGIEYIISERLFSTLDGEERKYWHPHNYEILSGQLVAPDVSDSVERALLQGNINSYGKTWHLWNTGSVNPSGKQQMGDRLPLGEPALAWSFNRDGENEPGLVAGRDQSMGIDSQEKRRQRAEWVALAKPQSGVNALRNCFARPTTPVPRVVNSGSRTITLYTELHRGY